MRTHRFPWRLSALSVVAASLTGCGTTAHSPISLALTSLGNSSSKDYGGDETKFMRSVSITGMDAHETVGTLSVDADKTNVWAAIKSALHLSTVDLPDSLNIRSMGGCSKLVVTEFGDIDSAKGDAAVKAIKTIRPLLQKARQADLELMEASLVADVLVAANKDMDAATETKQQSILEDVQKALPAKFASAKEKTDPKETPVTILAKALSQAKNARTLAEENQAKAENALEEQLQVPGVIVSNWTQTRKRKVKVQAGDGTAGFEKETEELIGGHVLLANPRVSTLMIGQDMVCQLKRLQASGEAAKAGCPNADKDGAIELLRDRKAYLTTYQLRARAVLYAEDKDDTSASKLQVDLSKVAGVVQGLATGTHLSQALKALEIGLSVESRKARQLSQSGFIQRPLATAASEQKTQQTVYEFRLSGPDHERSIFDELQRTAHTVPVYSARLGLKDLDWNKEMDKVGACGTYSDVALNKIPGAPGQALAAQAPSIRVAGDVER